MTTYEIIKHFDNVSGGPNHYMVSCPCHEDHRPSLSITAKDGVTLMHDFGGCNTKDILRAVGLAFYDLYDERNIAI